MISVNDLKTDSENDYEKLMPSIPSPEPMISCFDDLDFFEDFENEFPAIVYNDAQTSKSDLLTEPILNHQHIDKFDDETSLPEYDEKEQNVLHFNDLFPFNIIRSDDLKSEKDNDNNEIDIIQCFEDNESTHRYGSPTSEKGIRFIRLWIFGHVQLLRDSLFARMTMEHCDEVGVVVFTSQDWGRQGTTGLGAYLEFLSTLRFGKIMSETAVHLERGNGSTWDIGGTFRLMEISWDLPWYRIFTKGQKRSQNRAQDWKECERSKVKVVFILNGPTRTQVNAPDSKRRAFWSLNEDILKITIPKSNTPYPSRKIRHMAPLPPREQRHPFLRYQGLEYSDADIADFEERLERNYSREIHRVQVLDFQGMPELMRDGLFARMAMEHRDDVGVVVFTSLAWGRLFGTRGPLVWEFILEFLSTLRFRERFLRTSPSYTLIRDPVLRLCHRMMAHSIAGRSQAPEKVTVTDSFYLRGLDVGSVNILHIVGQISREARLAEHFGLLTAEILGGLTVIDPELPIIDMAELVRLQICAQFDDTQAWVAMGPERQPDTAVGASAVAEDAPAADEGDQAVSAPVQAPQQPPPPPPAVARTMPQRMARLEEDVYEIRRALTEQREVIDAMAHDFSRFSTWAVTGLTWMMDRAGVAYVPYSETHVPYQRCRVRQRTGEASTTTAQQDLQQPNP
ncbi:hypothetical protein Tco_1028652 [Tanacetum coccineum]|uniref:Uncharacterized protein n=1 Tax=Tanacetum coccineum TaxID=301880 RepID=A0ABQ5G188_9ASTR